MPTYVYKFIDTGETIEVQQSFDDDNLTEAVHPETGDTMPVKKVFLPVGITFKGDGFYKTDSRSSKGSTAASAGSSDSSSSSSEASGSSKASGESSGGSAGTTKTPAGSSETKTSGSGSSSTGSSGSSSASGD